MQAIEKKEKTNCIFLDFVKPVDTVSYEILLPKLGHYCIRGLPLLWFKPYLSNRKQTVRTGKTAPNFQTITCGVPIG